MNYQNNLKFEIQPICQLTQNLEALNFKDKLLINPVPIRANNDKFSAENVLAEYYDTHNGSLDVDRLVYDFAAYIELELYLKFDNTGTESNTSSEKHTENITECPFCD
jgi:hypothetical protein